MGALRHILFLVLLNTRAVWRLGFKAVTVVLVVGVFFGPLLAARLGWIDMAGYSTHEVARTVWMIRIACGTLVLGLWALQWQYDVLVRRLAPAGHHLYLRQ